jgi:predicted O-linked N-acetylglucosamine transferase (SPINDLY family)
MASDRYREVSPTPPSRASCNLPNDAFVFCSFNNSFKITAEIFDVWMNLLKAIPHSVLWLLEGNRFATSNLRREAIVRGVPVERLVFAPRVSSADHLARYRHADLFLDTPIYNAHTTASEALRMGCPVLTISGKTYASRVAGSLLRALDLTELITTTTEDYLNTALRLARESELLQAVKVKLAKQSLSSPLFDGAQFAKNMELAFEKMWSIHAAGQAPRPFAVDPRQLAERTDG